MNCKNGKGTLFCVQSFMIKCSSKMQFHPEIKKQQMWSCTSIVQRFKKLAEILFLALRMQAWVLEQLPQIKIFRKIVTSIKVELIPSRWFFCDVLMFTYLCPSKGHRCQSNKSYPLREIGKMTKTYAWFTCQITTSPLFKRVFYHFEYILHFIKFPFA